MTIILNHTDNNSTEQLDKLFTTIDLKKVLSNYKRDTNLGAISKMNKKQLIKVLHELQFKLHNIKDGDNLIYTFNLSQYDYDPDDPIKINKPLSKPKEIKPKQPKEIKPKPQKVVKPKLSITQQNISEYDKTMKFLDSNKEKLTNIPFGSIKRVNNPTKNYYDYFVNEIMVNGAGTGNQENYVKRAEYSIKYNKLILDKAKKILNKPSKEIKPKPSKEIEPKPSKEIEPPKKVVKKKKKLKIVSPVLTQREHINKNLSMAGVGRNDSGSSSFVDVTQEQIDTAREEGRISNSRIIADVKKFFRDDKGVYSSSKSITNRKELEHIYTRFLGIFQSNDPIMIQIKKKLYGKNAK